MQNGESWQARKNCYIMLESPGFIDEFSTADFPPSNPTFIFESLKNKILQMWHCTKNIDLNSSTGGTGGQRLWLTWACRLLPPLSPCYCLPWASPWSPPCPPWNTAAHSGRQQTTPGSSCPTVGHRRPANRFSCVSSLAGLWQEAAKRRPSSYPSRPICCKEGKAQTDHSSQVLHKGHLK